MNLKSKFKYARCTCRSLSYPNRDTETYLTHSNRVAVPPIQKEPIKVDYLSPGCIPGEGFPRSGKSLVPSWNLMFTYFGNFSSVKTGLAWPRKSCSWSIVGNVIKPLCLPPYTWCLYRARKDETIS